MADDTATTDQQTTTDTDTQQQNDPTWDSLRSTWEETGLTPGQILGRLEASRKWETRAKSAPSADELAALRADAERARALDDELSSEADKRAKTARAEAAQEADSRYRPLLAETAFRVAIGDRKTEDEVNEFIADLNLTRFLDDQGRVDTAKVLARVAEFAPGTGTQQATTRTGPTTAGQGNRGGTTRSVAGSGSVNAGRDLYAETHTPKSSR